MATNAAKADSDIGFLHLIDGEGTFTPTSEQVTQLLTQNIPQSTTAYYIVGIMGCQSTGKSTLLNRLFATEFQQMDNRKGRGQTTKGVWMDYAHLIKQEEQEKEKAKELEENKHPALFVMDLEGTDSGERGEDRTTFERQTSLFALSISSILIINMWEHDIGRYTASNYGILQTVFEVNLTLFEPQSPTVLLFIIRDHIEEDTPFTAIQQKLQDEINSLWGTVRKPEKFKDLKLSDMFILQFAGLPHLKLQPKEFDAAVTHLRNRFTNPSLPDYVFQSMSYEKNVPADGFGHYITTIWDTIRQNRELNLPSQREMLATFRCEEIIANIIHAFRETMKTYKSTLLNQMDVQFGATLSNHLHAALAEYDRDSKPYFKEIVSRKRVELIQKLKEESEDHISTQYGYLIDSSFEIFQDFLVSELSKESTDDIVDEFYQICDSARQAALENYHSKEKQIQVDTRDEHELASSTEQYLAALNSAIDDRVTKERRLQWSRLEIQLESRIQSRTSAFATIMKQADKDMWLQLAIKYNVIYEECESYIRRKTAALKCTGQEIEIPQKATHELLTSLVRTLVEHHITLILLYMRKRFDKTFRYDADGFIRRWKASDDIRAKFKECQADALSLISLFGTFQLPNELKQLEKQSKKPIRKATSSLTIPERDDESTSMDEGQTGEEVEEETAGDVLISEAKQREIALEFPGEIEGALREAEAEQERLRESHRLPAWGLALIAFLGFDEFMSILRNPLYLFFLTLLGAGIYALYVLNLLYPMLNYAQSHVEGIVQRILHPSVVPTVANSSSLSVDPNSAMLSPRPHHTPNGVSTSMSSSPATTTEGGFRPRASKIFNAIELEPLQNAPTPSEARLRKRTSRIVQ